MPSLLHELGRRNVIRVVIAYCIFAWVVAQVADVALDAFNAPGWAMQALLLALGIGLLVAAVFAWVFELTPEGLKKDSADTKDAVFARGVKRKLNNVITVVLAIAVIVLLADKLWLSKTTPASVPADAEKITTNAAPIKSIAVLPFNDLSPDGDQDYFSDGIAEELLNALVRIKGLRVSSRTSSFAFKGTSAGVPEIAGILNVDHIVEGSVRKVGNQLRISAQLIDVASDSQLWSETYEQTMDDVFAIQDDIAHRIVEALRIALSDEEEASLDLIQNATDSQQALNLYLRGRHLWHGRNPDNILTAIDLFEQALAIDPEFASARAALASAHMTYPTYVAQGGTDWVGIKEASMKASEKEALLALEQNDRLPEAYAVLADVERVRGHWQAAERYYLQALDVGPNDPTANLWYVEFLNDTGQVARAAEFANKAYSLDPLSPGANSNLAVTIIQEGRCNELEPIARAAAELGNFFGYISRAWCAILQKDLRAFRDIVAEIELLVQQPADQSWLPAIDAAVADPEAVPALIDVVRESDAGMDIIALFLVAYDRPNEAITLFLDWEPYTWAQMSSLFWLDGLEPMRELPEFKALLQKTGLLDYYQDTGRWPDDCRPVGEDFSCGAAPGR